MAKSRVRATPDNPRLFNVLARLHAGLLLLLTHVGRRILLWAEDDAPVRATGSLGRGWHTAKVSVAVGLAKVRNAGVVVQCLVLAGSARLLTGTALD